MKHLLIIIACSLVWGCSETGIIHEVQGKKPEYSYNRVDTVYIYRVKNEDGVYKIITDPGKFNVGDKISWLK